ncbi:MAG: hypothetical protein IPM07_25355 [Anaerolineales bacterium]|nr:hypothetical protein [Anaerolineales bacterium]
MKQAYPYIINLLVEWGRLEHGEVRSGLGFALPKYSERIGKSASVDNAPMINPDVGRMVAMLSFLPPQHYACMRLRFVGSLAVHVITERMGISRDEYYDRFHASSAMLDRWLRVDRATNGELSRQTATISIQVAHSKDVVTLD